jgi:hypothetical protein
MSFFEHQRPQYATLRYALTNRTYVIINYARVIYIIFHQIAKRDCYRELTDEPLWKLPRLLSTVDRGVV